jgi:hypothetical protein
MQSNLVYGLGREVSQKELLLDFLSGRYTPQSKLEELLAQL